MRWQSAAPPRGGGADMMVGTTTIRVRINVMPWLKRTVRIYLALPAQQPGPLGASWTTQGRLLPGQLRSGNRVLVYAGPITGGFIEDTLKVQFNVNAALMSRPCPVSFHFEMDELICDDGLLLGLSRHRFRGLAHGQGFAALVSPPRFELAAKPGKTLARRHRDQQSIHDAWQVRRCTRRTGTLSSDFSVTFHDDLQPGSCRPWVAIERPQIIVPGAGTMRYRFEVSVPADATPGECRFAVMIEGAEPSIAAVRASMCRSPGASA